MGNSLSIDNQPHQEMAKELLESSRRAAPQTKGKMMKTVESNWEQVFGPRAIECDVIRVEPAADGTLSIKFGLRGEPIHLVHYPVQNQLLY